MLIASFCNESLMSQLVAALLAVYIIVHYVKESTCMSGP